MEQKIKDEYRVPMYLFHEGSNARAYEFLGAHRTADGKTVFRVWAPNAVSVAVAGEFNGWSQNAAPMHRINDGAIWEAFVDGVKLYDSYKYSITARNGKTFMKADPYGFHTETRPDTASKFYDISTFEWDDDEWQAEKKKSSVYSSPVNIYEVHAGSWRLHDDGKCTSLIGAEPEKILFCKTAETFRIARIFGVFQHFPCRTRRIQVRKASWIRHVCWICRVRRVRRTCRICRICRSI